MIYCFSIYEVGDFILSNSATPGIPKFMGIDACIHDGWLLLSNFRDCDKMFLYYKLINDREKLLCSANGSVFKNLKTDIVKSHVIDLPPMNEQKRIVDILSSLDDKIELNNDMNKTLEDMAQSIFKRWFVDFEFPNEHGQPYKSSGGEMVESELGMIPKDWEVGKVKDLGNVITGKTPSTKKKENYGDEYPFITIPDMHNKIFITETERSLSSQGNESQSKKLIPINSIIVSCIATVGLVSINTRPSHTNQQINSIIPNENKYLYYLFYIMREQSEFLNLLGSSGTTTKNVNKSVFENIKIINPKREIVEKFYYTVDNIMEKIKNNYLENEKIELIRSSLLTKLMSGKIRID